jgi:hypothetical protein
VSALADAAVDGAGAALALFADELPLPFDAHAVMTVIAATMTGATYRVGGMRGMGRNRMWLTK